MPVESKPSNGAGILRDIEQGEECFRLTELPKQKFLPKRDGRPPHISAVMRWAQKPGGLESLKTPAGRVTTRSAVLRFFARLSGIQTDERTRSPARREKQLSRVEQELESAGI